MEDLSFSGIVNHVQGDVVKGTAVLITLGGGLSELRREIIATENKLRCLKGREADILTGTRYICQHLKKEMPLYVRGGDHILIVSENDLVMVDNVI